MQQDVKYSLLFLGFIFFVSCQKIEPISSPFPNMIKYINADRSLTILSYGLKKTNSSINSENRLDSILSLGGPYTLFAPTDSAFMDTNRKWYPLDKNRIDQLNPDTLATLLKGLIYKGKIGGSDIIGLFKIQLNTLDTNFKATFEKNYFGIFLDGAKSVLPNNVCSNGIVHIMSGRRLPDPETIIQIINRRPDLTYLAALYKSQPGLIVYISTKDRYGNPASQFTIYAPNNEAFIKSDPAYSDFNYYVNRLKNPTVSGGFYNLLYGAAGSGLTYSSSFIKGSPYKIDLDGTSFISGLGKIVEKDVLASNGVLHISNVFP
jgi:hypothetical protein